MLIKRFSGLDNQRSRVIITGVPECIGKDSRPSCGGKAAAGAIETAANQASDLSPTLAFFLLVSGGTFKQKLVHLAGPSLAKKIFWGAPGNCRHAAEHPDHRH